MSNVVVGVGDIAVTNNPGDVVKTFALGSCVAIIFWAPKFKTIGMAHVALPDSSLDRKKAGEKPGYFADTAIPHLIKEFRKLNITNNCQFMIKLAGGASIMDPNGKFNIGKRNALAIKKILWQYNLGALAEDLGNDYSRTISVDVDSGATLVTSPKLGEWKL